MTKKKLVFTKHAKDAMIKRKLDEGLIFNAINAPDEVFLDRRSSLMVAIKENNLPLVVVYDVINDSFEVVTAFRTSKPSKLIRSRLDKGYWVRVR
jgi:hypothetical protein